MEISALIALASQELSQLDAICPPEDIRGTDNVGGSLEHSKKLVMSIRNHIQAIERKFNSQLFDKGTLSQKLNANHRAIYAETLKPRLPAINQAHQILNPDWAELDQIFDRIGFPTGNNGKVKFTFEVAIERMYQLIDDNPELEFDFSVKSADRCLESELIRFDPDSWLDNAAELNPIVARGENHEIPAQLRYRLLEIFRSFVFGNYISVLCLARAALEYTIHDNLHRFDITPSYQVTVPKAEKRNKTLEELIDEVATHLPKSKSAMHRIRQNGNDFIHPKTSNVSKAQLFERMTEARWTVQELISVISGIYGFRASV